MAGPGAASQALALPASSPAATRAAAQVPVPAMAAAPVKPASSGGVVVTSSGAILPNARRTPGATNPSVTQATIHRTICVSGWTSTIRPPSSYTTGLKQSQLATGYAYRGDRVTSHYEEDHLVSLELGGSPTAVANLWPEPYGPALGAHKKDTVENTLHALVCSGALSLKSAQQAIASNWWAAYQRYVHVSAPTTPKPAPAPAPPPAPAPAPVPAPQGNPAPAGATAQCNDGTYSFSQHHQGTCSHHGGVAVWL